MTGWLDIDAVLPVAGVLAAVAALAVRQIRPVAAALLLLAAMLLRPGYLPVPYMVAMLPLAALLIAGVGDSVLRRLPVRNLARRGCAAISCGLRYSCPWSPSRRWCSWRSASCPSGGPGTASS